MIEVRPNFWLKEDIELQSLSEVDALIFDIDGVIIDVSRSFPEVVSEAAQYYLKEILDFEGDVKAIAASQTRLFKFAGGFNCDWDITYAVVLLYLYKSILYSSKNLAILQKLEPTIEDYTEAIKGLGGGLEVAEKIVFQQLPAGERQKIEALWDKDKLRQIFLELWAGYKLCEQIYGFQPKYYKNKGYIENERAILDKNKLPSHIKKLGIITGRTWTETQAALKLSKLTDLISRDVVICEDDKLRKPDPKGLIKLIQKFNAKTIIYVGDTIDDLRTVEYYKKHKIMSQLPKVFCCLVLSGYEGYKHKEILLNSGAEIVAQDVNLLMEVLSQRSGTNFTVPRNTL